jgi:hypothetical protein
VVETCVADSVKGDVSASPGDSPVFRMLEDRITHDARVIDRD